MSVIDTENGGVFAASASSDSTIRIWFRPSLYANRLLFLWLIAKPLSRNSTWEAIQTISRAPKMFETVSIAYISLPQPQETDKTQHIHNGRVIVAGGNVDGGIYLYAQQPQQEKKILFKQIAFLEGHQDWIRCLKFALTDAHNLVLASSSQDNRIRIWSIAPLVGSQIGELIGNDATSARISSKGHVVDLSADDGVAHKFVVLLDTVLAVHEDWVHSVAWHPRVRHGNTWSQPMCLLSASTDKTMIVWKPFSGGVWLDSSRVGEMGGNTLGFYGCAFSPNGDYILAHGHNGAFHLWKKSTDDAWEPVITVSGHFGGVEDLVWDTKGNYFVTVSEDKTARVFAPWIANSGIFTYIYVYLLIVT